MAFVPSDDSAHRFFLKAIFFPKTKDRAKFSRERRAMQVKPQVIEFCRKYAGLAVFVGGVGSRGDSAGLSAYLSIFNPFLNASASVDCIPASIGHAASFLLGKQ